MINSRPLLLLTSIILILLVSGCAGDLRPQLRDLEDFPQTADAYIGATPNIPVLCDATAARAGQDYLRRHFSPWHRSSPENKADEMFWGLKTFAAPKYYAENRLRHSKDWIEHMRRLCAVKTFPNANLKAISVAHTSMRVLPSHKPAFRSFDEAGEGFPFDYMQNSIVWAQTPLYVTHFSRDGAWVLVESSYAYGWVPVRDIAFIDDEDAHTIEQETRGFAAVTNDGVPVSDSAGLFMFKARIGMLLPVIGHDNGRFDTLTAVRNRNGRAELDAASISDQSAARFPVRSTPHNLARAANEMLNQPYGWGGMYYNRDCSALLRDLLTPFGIWLPRNSSQQAKHGRFTSLADLTNSEKIAYVLQRAKPWRTLLWKPGHIMLYIGQHQGKPMILHATWGIKTYNNGREGRHIIGRAVITGVELGKDLPDIAPHALIVDKLAGMTILPGRALQATP